MLKVHLVLLGVVLIYAASFTIVKDLIPTYIPPVTGIWLRICGALVLLAIYQFTVIKEKMTNLRDLGLLAVCAFFDMALNMVTFFEGLALTSPVNASIIMVSTPLLVVLMGFLLGKEQITLSKLAGLLAGTAGAALLLNATNTSGKDADMWGDVLILINAASYAVYLVLVGPLMKKYHPITVVFYGFLFSLVYVSPLGLGALSEARFSDMGTYHWFALGFVVVATTFLTYTLNAYALKRVPASVVGGYIYLQPLTGTLIALASGKYVLQTYHVVYGAMIMLGVYMVGKKVPPPQEAMPNVPPARH